tara:strand:+ start:44770 stop:45795 length:1026 start_codon:yes stop_codon:yes gene_type:complete
MTFEFHSPEILWLLLSLPLLAFVKGRRGKQASILFSSIALARKIASPQRSQVGNLLLVLRLLAIGLFIVALARPQAGKGDSETNASGVDIVLALDFSSSMLALDFSTESANITRIDVAKEVMKDFIKKRPNDRMGLVAFAGGPYLVSPLTLNHDWLVKNLDRLRVGTIEDGTAIGSALAMGANRLKDLPAKSRVIVLLTDGVNNRGRISPLVAAEAAAAYGVKIYTVAVGIGGRVPLLYLDRHGRIARNRWGEPDIIVTDTPVDEQVLEDIARLTNAKAFRAKDRKELKAIYDEIDQLEKTEIKLKQYAYYEELFMWPVLAGLLMLILEKSLANTRWRRLP